MSSDSLNLETEDKALLAAYAKYEREWSDAECPITPQEQAAYIAGWSDARDHYGKQAEEANDAIMAMSDSLGVMANG